MAVRFVARPEMSEVTARAVASGADQRGWIRGPSRSWWELGALIVDDVGAAVVDAEGRRVPAPVVPGGKLVEIVWSGGGYGSIRSFYLCDRDNRCLAEPPHNVQGFTSDPLRAWAEAAGLTYEKATNPPRRRYPEPPGCLTLWLCALDTAERLRRSKPKLLRWRPKVFPSDPYGGSPVNPFPVQDPSYLTVVPWAYRLPGVEGRMNEPGVSGPSGSTGVPGSSGPPVAPGWMGIPGSSGSSRSSGGSGRR